MKGDSLGYVYRPGKGLAEETNASIVSTPRLLGEEPAQQVDHVVCVHQRRVPVTGCPERSLAHRLVGSEVILSRDGHVLSTLSLAVFVCSLSEVMSKRIKTGHLAGSEFLDPLHGCGNRSVHKDFLG